MHVLGDPQHAYPLVHITGTNGKGSTARIVDPPVEVHGLDASAPTPART